MDIKEIKRRIRAELCAVNPIMLAVFAGVALLLGVIFALSGIGRYPYFYFVLPKGALPSFLLVLFWCVFYAVLGASLCVFLFASRRPSHAKRQYALMLFLSVLVLSYAWFTVVYKAGSFFLGLFISVAVLFCLFVLLGMLWRSCLLPLAGMALYALWMLYVLFYSFSLLLLNG